VRAGFTHVFEQADLDIVGQAAGAAELIRKVGAHRPDAAVLELRREQAEREEDVWAVGQVRTRWPEVGVLVLSDQLGVGAARQLTVDGTRGFGYLRAHRLTEPEQLRRAVHRVAAGYSCLDSHIVSSLLAGSDAGTPLDELSPREAEVLALLAQGRSNQGIGSLLFLSERGVEKHITSIYSKLSIPSERADHRRVLAALIYNTHQSEAFADAVPPQVGEPAPHGRPSPGRLVHFR